MSRRGRALAARASVGLATALAALLLCRGARCEGLGIELKPEGVDPLAQLQLDAAIPNPHDMACDECHLPGVGGAAAGPLKSGEDTLALCNGCHTDANLHPVGIPVAGAGRAGLPLPLGRGPLEGKITCLTCHYVHREKGYERRLLRTAVSTGTTRIEALCAACHGGNLREKSPHLGSGEACRLCHMTQPRPGEGLKTLSVNVQSVCNFCHSALENRHFLALDPFTDEYLFTDPDDPEIPKIGGRFTCISCHDPHAGAGRKKLLRERYLQLAGLSKKINPHWKNVMCIACHDEREPARGAPNLKEGGDVIRLCYRCHAFKYSRSDIHPVNCTPSRAVTIPEDMPLTDGRLTCSTCHDSSLQEQGERSAAGRRANPKFLRGGFTSRKEFCARCHGRGLVGKLNAHDQLDVRGKPDRVKCLFCHSSLPEGRAGWMVRAQFEETEANDLCLLCHEERYQDSHPRAPHFLSPSRRVQEAMETSEERVGISFPLIGDTIVCITCHNPHQEGVIARAAGTAEEGVGPKRLRVGANICAGCHEAK